MGPLSKLFLPLAGYLLWFIDSGFGCVAQANLELTIPHQRSKRWGRHAAPIPNALAGTSLSRFINVELHLSIPSSETGSRRFWNFQVIMGTPDL